MDRIWLLTLTDKWLFWTIDQELARSGSCFCRHQLYIRESIILLQRSSWHSDCGPLGTFMVLLATFRLWSTWPMIRTRNRAGVVRVNLEWEEQRKLSRTRMYLYGTYLWVHYVHERNLTTYMYAHNQDWMLSTRQRKAPADLTNYIYCTSSVQTACLSALLALPVKERETSTKHSYRPYKLYQTASAQPVAACLSALLAFDACYRFLIQGFTCFSSDLMGPFGGGGRFFSEKYL